jgi:hypothetical protein
MILRYWRGRTTPANADAYERLVDEVILPSISDRKLEGYHGAYLLRRSLAEEIEFATITKFDSIEAVRVFAGEDYETAYVPVSAREVLKSFDDRSAHYEVLRSPEETRER